MSDSRKKPICHLIQCISSRFIFLISLPIPNTQVLEESPPPPFLPPGQLTLFIPFKVMHTACFTPNICKSIENKTIYFKQTIVLCKGKGECFTLIKIEKVFRNVNQNEKKKELYPLYNILKRLLLESASLSIDILHFSIYSSFTSVIRRLLKFRGPNQNAVTSIKTK